MNISAWVENYRQGDKIRQRVILHVGAKIFWPPTGHAGAPAASRSAGSHLGFDRGSFRAAGLDLGPVRVARHLFDSLSLGPSWTEPPSCFAAVSRSPERVFPLVVNRLTRPGSEHALAQWLEDFYVVTAEGSRWMPQWKASRRVKVSFEQLRLWYETLDDVLAGKPQIETALWQELRDLFSIEARTGVLRYHFDLLRGSGPAELDGFGYSRDGKPRNRRWSSEW